MTFCFSFQSVKIYFASPNQWLAFLYCFYNMSLTQTHFNFNKAAPIIDVTDQVSKKLIGGYKQDSTQDLCESG